MGGIWKMIKQTYDLMWIGTLALAGVGIPGRLWFAGFYSKDIIIESAFAAHTVGMYSPSGWASPPPFMTAFYSWRLLFMTFHGEPRGG